MPSHHNLHEHFFQYPGKDKDRIPLDKDTTKKGVFVTHNMIRESHKKINWAETASYDPREKVIGIEQIDPTEVGHKLAEDTVKVSSDELRRSSIKMTTFNLWSLLLA